MNSGKTLAQAKRKKENAKPLSVHVNRAVQEGIFYVLLAVAVFLLLALLTYNKADPGWSHTGQSDSIANWGGVIGSWFADITLFLFGYLAYLFPIMVAYSGWLIMRNNEASDTDKVAFTVRWVGFFLLLLSGCGLGSFSSVSAEALPQAAVGAGGVLGNAIGISGLSLVLGSIGTKLLLLAIFCASITLFTGISWLRIMDMCGKGIIFATAAVVAYAQKVIEEIKLKKVKTERAETFIKKTEVKIASRKKKKPRIEPTIKAVEPSQREFKEKQINLFDAPADTELPPIKLLDLPKPQEGGYSNEALEALSQLVEHKLADFNITVEVVAVHPGPVVTRFELQPAPGIKASKITSLSQDLARSLSVTSVRVVEVIPGKSYIGLEIPNEQRELVALSEILNSKNYDAMQSPLTLALGKDIGGKPVVADLAKMPHLLVAGTTGAGKSVALNAMLLSLLYKASARDVRLLLIDPKMLELSVYEGIPHLLTPVITDMKEASNGLRWCVAEMERRYKLMSALGVRNVGGYNKKIKDAELKGEKIPDPLYNPETAFDPEAEPPTLNHMPYIVVIIDELADMMMVVGKKVEELIARLAQKARAAGLHLVLATQRPSVDVITGLIKANVPTRIAFQVSSRIDSRTILDQMGAESLLGHGDMLYLPPGTSLPERVHGAFVDDHEVHKVVEHLKKGAEPDYIEGVIDESQPAIPGIASESDEDSEQDALYDQAVAIVTETRKASISYVQRRLKIGYNRSARMLEAMEMAGVVSALQSNGTREVLAPPPIKD